MIIDFGKLHTALRGAGFAARKFDDGIVVNGDCIAVMELMAAGGFVVDSVITDPPWIPIAASYESQAKGGRKTKKRLWADISLLGMAFELIAGNVRSVQRDGGASCFFCGDISAAVMAKCLYENWNRIQLVPWEKFGGAQGRVLPPFKAKLEFFWYCADGIGHAPRKMSMRGEAYPPIFRCKSVDSAARVHPAEKPVELLEQMIRLCVPEGGVVADFFAGSHSLLRAARNTGRKFVCVEADEEFSRRAVALAKQAGVRKILV